MRRRLRQYHHTKPDEEDTGRWLVSYADFITLLFAFFVVMYAISSVNESKYEVLSETLNAIFRVFPEEQATIHDTTENPNETLAQILDETLQKPQSDEDRTDKPWFDNLPSRMADISARLTAAIERLVEQGVVDVAIEVDRVKVEFQTDVLFEPGQSRLLPQALGALDNLSHELLGVPNLVQVEGIAQSQKLQNSPYHSSWELAAARAAAVANYLQQQGIETARLAAVGRSEYRRLGGKGNASPATNNRRVTVYVYDGLESQRLLKKEGIEIEVPWAEAPALENE